jgi:RNA polymerase sigma factor (sigma-70 family)
MEDLAALVARARDGDADAFGVVVRRFQDMAVGYACALLRDKSLAEDAAQEAFLEAYLSLPQIHEPAAFPGWFRRIVFKQCDRMTRGRPLRLEPLEVAGERRSSEPSQADAMEQREMADQIWTTTDSLPRRERTAMVLYYLSGHSLQEVSRFLGVPVTTIKKRLFSARRRLREMMMDLVADGLRRRRPSRDERFAAGVIAILHAARAGDAARVKDLLAQNPRLLAARDWLGNSALIMAVNSGHHVVAELLFKAGVRPDIHEAAAIGDTERVAILLSEDTLRLDAFSAEGFTPLALAAHFGHIETARFLVGQGADVDVVSRHPVGVTPLHAALFGRQVGMARLLIESGANVRARRGGKGWPRAGWTALHYVAGYGLLDLIEPLLAHGADPAQTDDEGRTPLRVAIEECQDDAADMLRRRSASPAS